MIAVFAVWGFFALGAGAQGIVASGAKLELISGDFAFTEGPACDAEGNVYFTDQPNDRIMKYGIDGKLTTFMQPCGRSNGLCFDGGGNLIACADEKNELWSIDVKTKMVTVLVRDYGGKLLNGPNDVWVHPGGGLYITDPWYKRDYWNRGPQEQPVHGVYYLGADRKELKIVVTDLMQPNGIIGTPDGKTIYISDIDAKKIYSYGVRPDGSLADKKFFCDGASDGMTIDDEGNVYISNDKGVTVFNRAGRQIDNIPVHENWTGNVCFGGKDRRTLFITASKGLYAIRTRTKGVGSQ